MYLSVATITLRVKWG